jgi:hypothetical protein
LIDDRVDNGRSSVILRRSELLALARRSHIIMPVPRPATGTTRALQTGVPATSDGSKATSDVPPVVPPQTPDTSSGPHLIVDKTGYVLRLSSFIDTNDEDKVDVDTGCPGWGGMRMVWTPPTSS